MSFHSALDALLLNLSSQLPGFKYSLGNGYRMTIDVINYPQAFGKAITNIKLILFIKITNNHLKRYLSCTVHMVYTSFWRVLLIFFRFPIVIGFEHVDSACCGQGLLNAQGPCNLTASLCPDRRKYLFWDLYHPTKKAAFLAAQTLYSGPTYYVSPINFSQLAKDN